MLLPIYTCWFPSAYLPVSFCHVPLPCTFASCPFVISLCYEPLSGPIGHVPLPDVFAMSLPCAFAMRRRHMRLLCARIGGHGQVGKWAREDRQEHVGMHMLDRTHGGVPGPGQSQLHRAVLLSLGPDMVPHCHGVIRQ